MYSNARRLTLYCILLVILNIIGTTLTTLYILGLRLGYAPVVSLLLFVISNTVTLLAIIISIRSILQDMEIEVSDRNHNIKKLAERINKLENKAK